MWNTRHGIKERRAAMSIDWRFFLRIAGSFVGLLVGGVIGVALAWLLLVLCCPSSNGDPSDMGVWFDLLIFGGLGLLIGGTIGAAVGATMVQGATTHTTSYKRALLGAFIGSLVPFVGTVIGATIASLQADPPESIERVPAGKHLCPNCGCREADGSKTCRWCGANQE
jgi:hypothetical protein